MPPIGKQSTFRPFSEYRETGSYVQVTRSGSPTSRRCWCTRLSETFQFVHVLVQKSAGTDSPVIATIDSSVRDASTVEQFVPLFEYVIETRQTDAGDQQLRVQKPELTE